MSACTFSSFDQTDSSGPEIRLIRKASREGIPLIGTLELLPQCSLACAFCYVNRKFPERGILGTFRSPERSFAPTLPAEDWLALAEELKKAGCLFLLLTGGEPFLHPEFLPLYAALRDMGFILTIHTNGTLITGRTARFLEQRPPRRVNVSLYGTSDRTYERLCHVRGGFTAALRGIRHLLEAGIDLRITCSAVRGNREEIEEIFSLGHSLGIPVFAETYLLPDSGSPAWRLSPEEAARLRVRTMPLVLGPERFRKEAGHLLSPSSAAAGKDSLSMSCLAGLCAFAVGCDGRLRLCSADTGASPHGRPAGQDGFTFPEEWERLKERRNRLLLPSACGGCRNRRMCRICPVSAGREREGAGMPPSYLCRYSEASLSFLCSSLQNPAAGSEKRLSFSALLW